MSNVYGTYTENNYHSRGLMENLNLLGDKGVSPEKQYFCNTCLLCFTKAGIMSHLDRHMIPYSNVEGYLVGADYSPKTKVGNDRKQ